MMRIKKLISAVLLLALLLNISVSAFALQGSESSVAEVEQAMSTVSNSLMTLNDTASSGEAASLASVFSTFIDVARTSGQVLAAINGSVTFLRLIGLVTDPTQSKLSGILSQLQVIDERLSGMDDKLNDLTTAMSELKASLEFNTRTEKAILYESSWRDFEYRYMENGMDKLISQYNSMLRTGLMSWCSGSRNENNVDNSRIIILYDNVDGVYTLSFSDYNGIPSGISDEDGWVILPAECLPSQFYYDVNTFNSALAKDIASRISAAVSAGELGMFETHNFPLLTEAGIGYITDEDIAALAADAVNTLVYRVAASRVNADASFAGEVSRQFSNYCSHLQTSGDGLDATLKTLYLTHAFEYSVADDLRDFCDRMIILTGTYGMFAANVLGMSRLTTDSEKLSAVSQMSSAIEMARQAKENGITGSANYCYITGTKLEYGSVTFRAAAEINAHYTMSNTTYESFNGTQPYATLSKGISVGAAPAGDTAMIVLVNTLMSNGITPTHDYLSKNIGNGSVGNYAKIVTGYSAAQSLSLDGKTRLHVKNAFGDYFSDNSTISSLPGDAENEYMVFRRKISGSLYDLSSGALISNATLCAIAAYGENHFYWVTDEGALMGGPSDSAFFKDEYSVTKTGSDSTGVIRQHLYKTNSTYNILLSVPLEKSVKLTLGTYDPLTALEDEVPPCEYDPGSYEEGSGLVGLQLGSQGNKGSEKSALQSASKAETVSSGNDAALKAETVEKQAESTEKPVLQTASAAEATVGTPSPQSASENESNDNTELSQSQESSGNGAVYILITVSASAIAAAVYYTVKKKKKQ